MTRLLEVVGGPRWIAGQTRNAVRCIPNRVTDHTMEIDRRERLTVTGARAARIETCAVWCYRAGLGWRHHVGEGAT